MPFVQVGIMALRSPTGEFMPATPIYKEVERVTPDGLTPQEGKNITEISKVLAEKFKQYKDGCAAEKGSL